MEQLKKEYADVRGRTHRVDHITVRSDDKERRERILNDLFRALTPASKHIPA